MSWEELVEEWASGRGRAGAALVPAMEAWLDEGPDVLRLGHAW